MIERIVTYYEKRKRLVFNKKLIKENVLSVGKNSNIDNLEIVLAYSGTKKQQNIIIGDDCILNCKIIIYSESARVTIGNRVYIGPDTTLFCYDKIAICDDILFSWGITVIDTNAHAIAFEQRKDDVMNWHKGKKDWSNVISKPVIINSKSWIGFNSIISKGVTIEEGGVVASGSVVVKDVPFKTVVGGNPAQIIKQIGND